MRTRSFVHLVALAIIVGCSQASNITDLGKYRLSLCVIDLSANRPPALGTDWHSCKDQASFTAQITKHSALSDGPNIILRINEPDRPALESFLRRNARSTTALLKGEKVLRLMAIAGTMTSPMELYLDAEETAAFEGALE